MSYILNNNKQTSKQNTHTHTHTHTHAHTHTHTHTRTHARTHAHTHTHWLTWGRLEIFGSVRSKGKRKLMLERWVLSCDLKAKTEHAAQRKGGCSRRRDNEREGALSLKRLASVQNTDSEDAIISRGAESAWWDVQFKVRQVRRSSVWNHAVADCSNLVFYSTFYWQPMQIPIVTCSRLGALRQDEQHNSSHAELCLQLFEGYHAANRELQEYKRESSLQETRQAVLWPQ